jgi:hypothetical protein
VLDRGSGRGVLTQSETCTVGIEVCLSGDLDLAVPPRRHPAADPLRPREHVLRGAVPDCDLPDGPDLPNVPPIYGVCR